MRVIPDLIGCIRLITEPLCLIRVPDDQDIAHDREAALHGFAFQFAFLDGMQTSRIEAMSCKVQGSAQRNCQEDR